MTAIEVIVALIVGVVGAAAGYFVGYNNRCLLYTSPSPRD